jgi:hypothetical protein
MGPKASCQCQTQQDAFFILQTLALIFAILWILGATATITPIDYNTVLNVDIFRSGRRYSGGDLVG